MDKTDELLKNYLSYYKSLGLNCLSERIWTELLTYRVNLEISVFYWAVSWELHLLACWPLQAELQTAPFFFSFSPGYYTRGSEHCSGGVKWIWTLAQILMMLLCQVIVTDNAKSTLYTHFCLQRWVWYITVKPSGVFLQNIHNTFL